MDILSSLKLNLSKGRKSFSAVLGNTLRSINTQMEKSEELAQSQPYRALGKIANVFGTPIKPAKYVLEEFIRRPAFRASAQLGTTLAGQDVFKPSDYGKFGEKLYGKEDIWSIPKVAREGPVTGSLEKKGVPSYAAVPFSFLGATALAVSDLIPTIGATKNVGKKVGKEIVETAVPKLIGKTLSADAISDLVKNSLKKIPKDAKAGVIDKHSIKEAVTGLASNGKYLKNRIVLMVNDAGELILEDGRHLLEAYRNKGLPIPEDKVAFKQGNKLLPISDEIISEFLDKSKGSVDKVFEALKKAGPIRKEQEKLYTAGRVARMPQIESALEIPGEAGYKAALQKMKGPLSEKLDFEPLKIAQKDIDEVFNVVKNSNLFVFDKVTALRGLSSLIQGNVPTESEIALLRKVLPEEFVQEALSKRDVWRKAYEGGINVLNLPKSIVSSFDLSAPLRQGVFLVGRPKQWLPAFKDMFKYAFSQKAYDNLGEELASRPTYNLLRDAKLAITDMGGISTREETFLSNLAERIPGIGKIVKGSNRAYSGFLTKLRADVADDMIRQAQKLGRDVGEGSPLLRGIGDYVNTATGRGSIWKFEKVASELNALLFSPRLMSSRLKLLPINPASWIYYAKMDPFVRKQAVKDLASFVAFGTSVLGLAKLALGDKAEIGVNPTSADFGKIKIGNTRYDIWGGFQQYAKLMAQLIKGEITSTTTGETSKVGEGYKPITRKQLVYRFLEQKEAPIPAYITSLADEWGGKDISFKKDLKSLFIPLILQDFFEVLKEEGLVKGTLMELPGVFGIGTQTYEQKPKSPFSKNKNKPVFSKPKPSFSK